MAETKKPVPDLMQGLKESLSRAVAAETKDTPEPNKRKRCGARHPDVSWQRCGRYANHAGNHFAMGETLGWPGWPNVPTPEPSVMTDPQLLDRNTIYVGIMGALKSTVKAHGPLSGRHIGSAAKRVLGQVLATVESQRARDHRIAWETIQQLANKVAELDDALTLERQQHRDALAAQAQEIADLSKVRVAHVGDHEPVLVFRSWDAAVREVEHAHRVIHRLNAELTQVRSRLTAVEQIVKLFATRYPAAIASLPENGMERVQVILSSTPTAPQTPEDRK